MNPLTLKKYIPFLLPIILFGVYLSTTSPTVYLGDSGELTAAAFSLGIPHNSGYPLYTLLGKLFSLIPLGNIGFRINLMSAFFSVLTVWLVYSLIFKMTSSKLSALSGSLILAFIPIFWSQTVAAEVYPLHTFFVVLLIRLLWRWDETRNFSHLVLFVFVTGLSFGNHLQTVMLFPAVLFIILSVDKKALLDIKNLLLLSVFFILPLSLYLYLPIRTDAGAAIHWGDPNTLSRFLEHVTARAHRGGYVLNKAPSEYLVRTREMLWLVGSQFGVILLLPLWAWLKLPSTRWRVFFAAVVLFDFVYTIFMNTVSLEITAFTLPTSIVMATLTGIGIAHILIISDSHPKIGTRLHKCIQLACLTIPFVLFNFSLGRSNQSRNYNAYEHALNIFRTLDNGSTLFLDGDNNVFPVTYGRVVERMREDVTLYDRYNLFFKMPYMDDRKGHFTFYGKWEKLRAILEEKIIDKRAGQGVYFALFNPFAVSMPDHYTLVPFGILDKVVGDKGGFNTNLVNKVWEYYSTESFYEDFELDYMNREVISYFYFDKGKHFFMTGASDAGLKYFKLASQVGYNDDMIHSDMALFLTDRGFFKEAREELDKALIYHENKGGIFNNWGYYYSKLRNHDRAIKSFRKAIELDPQNYGYYNNLGFSLYETGKKKESLLVFQKSLAINGDQPNIDEFIEKLRLGHPNDKNPLE